jgi:hypothetical protein
MLYYQRTRVHAQESVERLYYYFTTTLLLLYYYFTTRGRGSMRRERREQLYYCFTTTLLPLYYYFTTRGRGSMWRRALSSGTILSLLQHARSSFFFLYIFFCKAVVVKCGRERRAITARPLILFFFVYFFL